jgi:exosortase
MSLTRRHIVFAAYCLAAAALYADVLRALYDYSQADRSASHLVLMPVMAAALVYRSRAAIFASVSTDLAAGGMMVGAGIAIALAIAARTADEATISLGLATLSLVTIWAGGFTLIYGRRAVRRALFPLLFLGLTIPIPQVLLNAAIGVLKAGSADAVATLFTLTGTVYHREGFVFSLPNVAIEIADECSGIRSTIALTLTAALAGHLYLNSSLKTLILMIAVLPITILKNAIRIVTLTLLSVHVDPSFLSGQLHHDGGILFFILGLAMMVPILAILRAPWRRVRLRTTAPSIAVS